ncbi:MAG: maleylpyruvate isomerase family mycothiol-dependent enzyme [Actinomycetes bacterium]|jgi:hypothetical protein
MPESTDLADAWLTSLTSFSELVAGLSPAQWNSPSPCPGWSVGDLVAHTVDIEERMAGVPQPDYEPDWDALPHVTESGRRMEPGVDRRRGLDRSVVLDQLSVVSATRSAQVADLDPEATIVSPFGREITLSVMMRMRIFDVWVHEQDIRVALNLPGNLTTVGGQVTQSMIIESLPRTWAKSAAAPEGSVLCVDVIGSDLPRTVWVRAGEEGRGEFLDTRPENIDVTIMGTWPALLAAATGRSSDTRLNVQGDAKLAQALVSNLNMAP